MVDANPASYLSRGCRNKKIGYSANASTLARLHAQSGQTPSMFIRRTRARRMADGSRYTTCHLMCNERIGDRVRQVTLPSLGAVFGVPRERWRELTSLVNAAGSGSG